MTPPSPSTTATSATTDLPSSLTASLLRSRPYKFSTQCATVDNPDLSHKDQYGSSSVPIYQTATFKGMGGRYDYTRSGNPTRSHLEHHIAKISSAQHAYAVTSGMSALDVIFRLLKPGDEIIAGNDLYGGSNRLLTYLKEHNGIITHHVDTTRPHEVLPHLQKEGSNKIAMVLLETPTNPLLQIADIAAISKLVHQYVPTAIVVVDNTMMSPYLQRPLEHGADIVYDSGTKYLSGHHDLMAGVISCNRDDIAKQIYFVINSVGNALPPFDSFLLLRGIKTLALRLDRQQATTSLIATYLDNLGFKVNYPGLANHPGKEVHDRLASGAGAVLSFETGDVEMSERIVASARLWGISVSFGCVNSLISMPCLMSHASISPALRAARNLPEDLIRLCIGIEDPEDLVDDLEAALLEAGAVRVIDEAGVVSEGVRRPLERVGAGVKSPLLAQELERVLVVSAPGKVILFGEHAVVHGITAIAASISLRCYTLAQTTASVEPAVTISLPDLGFAHSWTLASLPWDLLPGVQTGRGTAQGPREDEVPDKALVSRLDDLVRKTGIKKEVGEGVKTCLWLFMTLSSHGANSKLATSFTIRSSLPIGAGLGSSAALSVSVSTALIYLNSHLALPAATATATHSDLTKSLINAYALQAEKILHGSPSGIDNTVSTQGGALAYRKAIKGRDGATEALEGCASLRFLLTDSGVARDTKRLVEGVSKRKLEEPDTINPLLRSISHISSHVQLMLTSTSLSRAAVIAELEGLMEENHSHLVSLGVGHEKLEVIRKITQAHGLVTKLTGAGGGGCMVTLLPETLTAEALASVTKELAAAGCTSYETLVGGPGFELFIPEAKGYVFTTLAKDFVGTPTQGLEGWVRELK